MEFIKIQLTAATRKQKGPPETAPLLTELAQFTGRP